MFGHPQPQPAPYTGPRLLTIKDLPAKGIHYHSNHLRKLWNQGDFPKPEHLSPRKLIWREEVIDAWIAARLAA